MASSAPDTLPRLLVFEQRMMGDAIMSLPFIRAAQTQFEVHVACAPGTTRIFNLALPSQNIHPWHPPWLEANGGSAPDKWGNLKNYLIQLKALAPAVAVSVWADPRVHYLMARCGAKTRVGFPMSKQNYYAHHLPWRRRQLRIGRILGGVGSLLNGSPQLTTKVNRTREDQHHVDNWKQLAEALSLPWDESTPWFTPPDANLPDSIRATIHEARRANKPLWLVHPGARVPAQRWPLNYFLEMIRTELIPAGARPILIDSPELQWPDAVRAEFPTCRLDSLDSLITLFNACDGLLCNDTGVSHLAAALGKSVVAVFLASNPNWFGPRGPRCRWIANERSLTNPPLGRLDPSELRPEEIDLREGVRKALRELRPIASQAD